MRVFIRYFLLLLSAFTLALALTSASKQVNSEYYNRWPLQGDTASYWIRDLRIMERALTAGYYPAVIQEAADNNRDPARTIFYALLKPQHIFSASGHLYFSGFSALLFFWTLSLCLWNRTGSLIYAVGAPVASLLAVGLFSPMYGLPSKLPDMPAALLFGAALFALFISNSGQKLRWLFISGALLGLATLTRYHVWIYGGFVLGPIVTTFALGNYLRTGRRIRQLIIPHVAFLTGLAVVAGWFIFRWAADAFTFYAIAGYGLNATASSALHSTGLKLIIHYFGIPAITAFLLLMTTYVATCWQGRKSIDWVDLSALLWAASSCMLLILLIMRVEDDLSQTYYMVPGITLFWLSPFVIKNLNAESKKTFTIFAVAATVILCWSAAASHYLFVRSEGFLYPRPQTQELYKFNNELAALIVAQLPPKETANHLAVIDTNFDYYARYMVPEIQLHFGRQTKFGNVFQIRQSQWRLSYTGIETEDKQRIMPDLAKKVDVFAAITQFSSSSAQATLKDEYTRLLAEYVANQMAMSPTTWERRGTVQSPYGEVTIYRNISRVAAPSGTDPIPLTKPAIEGAGNDSRPSDSTDGSFSGAVRRLWKAVFQ